MWWQILVGATIAVVAAWLVLVAALVRLRPRGTSLRDAARLLPDTLRLLRRLASDSSVPRAVRIRLWLLFAYLASPIDLVPDFVPVIGYADDAIITAVVLRSVVRATGREGIESRWPGSAEGLATLWRFAGIPPSTAPSREGGRE